MTPCVLDPYSNSMHLHRVENLHYLFSKQLDHQSCHHLHCTLNTGHPTLLEEIICEDEIQKLTIPDPNLIAPYD